MRFYLIAKHFGQNEAILCCFAAARELQCRSSNTFFSDFAWRSIEGQYAGFSTLSKRKISCILADRFLPK